MKRSPKIILAIIVAVIFVGGAVFSVFKQSQNTRNAQGTLSSADGGWVLPVESEGTNASSTSLIDTNLTTILSKQVFSNFMVLNQSGNLNTQTINDLTDQLSSQIIEKVPKAKTYTVADLNIVSNPTKEDIKKYGNDFFILRNNSQNAYIRGITAQDSPLLDTSENGVVGTYVLVGKIYEKMSVDLLKLSVPKELIELHLKIVNNYAETGYGLKQFGQLNTDPVVAIAGLNIYKANSEQEDSLLLQIASYFVRNDIIFNENEPGYGWNIL